MKKYKDIDKAAKAYADLIIQISNTDELKKQHQVKSKWYYIFWGSMAVAVVVGQVYIGLGYREMANAFKSIQISVSCVK